MAYSERFTLEQAKQLIIDNSSDEESISEHEEITDYSDVEFTDEKGNEPFLVEDSADDDDEIKYTLQSSNVQNDSSNSDLGSSDESNDNEKSKTFSMINFGHKDDLVETKIPAILSKSGRCHACPRIKDKKTALKCSKCNKPTCRDHVFMICRNCSTN
ncbi:hypothetical protein HELRODRAFT_169180 [Helobdella robusta]|uniref:PiggyBac transposable element-derived protein 4 C-terminal zinc-ribbon domain-containing protein n=1 Tax=Helobdella robusta TaxID=6412 RepID=T1F1J2_HELRO|nr:hypothetical protein HELRODRAFT_169180 [Helobdella robusta]ESO08365.1 hypothetical protein HELRODRAFT_169180 [Helobdella robusta]